MFIIRNINEVRIGSYIRPLFYSLVLSTVLSVFYKTFNWWQLDQINQINCSKYPLDVNHFNPSQNFIAQELYCYGVTAKKMALEEIKNKEVETISSLKIIQSLLKAAQLGLTLGKKELCRPSTFYGIDLKNSHQIDVNELESYCCPKGTLSLCPWGPVIMHNYRESGFENDRSTNDQGMFSHLF